MPMGEGQEESRLGLRRRQVGSLAPEGETNNVVQQAGVEEIGDGWEKKKSDRRKLEKQRNWTQNPQKTEESAAGLVVYPGRS